MPLIIKNVDPDQLKKLAKNLTKNLKNQSNLSLTQIQNVLAKSLGYHSWHEYSQAYKIPEKTVKKELVTSPWPVLFQLIYDAYQTPETKISSEKKQEVVSKSIAFIRDNWVGLTTHEDMNVGRMDWAQLCQVYDLRKLEYAFYPRVPHPQWENAIKTTSPQKIPVNAEEIVSEDGSPIHAYFLKQNRFDLFTQCVNNGCSLYESYLLPFFSDDKPEWIDWVIKKVAYDYKNKIHAHEINSWLDVLYSSNLLNLGTDTQKYSKILCSLWHYTNKKSLLLDQSIYYNNLAIFRAVTEEYTQEKWQEFMHFFRKDLTGRPKFIEYIIGVAKKNEWSHPTLLTWLCETAVKSQNIKCMGSYTNIPAWKNGIGLDNSAHNAIAIRSYWCEGHMFHEIMSSPNAIAILDIFQRKGFGLFGDEKTPSFVMQLLSLISYDYEKNEHYLGVLNWMLLQNPLGMLSTCNPNKRTVLHQLALQKEKYPLLMALKVLKSVDINQSILDGLIEAAQDYLAYDNFPRVSRKTASLSWSREVVSWFAKLGVINGVIHSSGTVFHWFDNTQCTAAYLTVKQVVGGNLHASNIHAWIKKKDHVVMNSPEWESLLTQYIDGGGDINVLHNGTTFLHACARENWVEAYDFFVKLGADENVLDHQGRTALGCRWKSDPSWLKRGPTL